jgi:hypothetical protein
MQSSIFVAHLTVTRMVEIYLALKAKFHNCVRKSGHWIIP